MTLIRKSGLFAACLGVSSPYTEDIESFMRSLGLSV
jgi:hypothetical protein